MTLEPDDAQRAEIARSNRRTLTIVAALSLLGAGVPLGFLLFGDVKGPVPDWIAAQEREIERREQALANWRSARSVEPFDKDRSPIAEVELEASLALAQAVWTCLQTGEFEAVQSRADVEVADGERLHVEQFGPTALSFRLDAKRFPRWFELEEALERRR